MKNVAVVAHTAKSLGGGLDDLRTTLARHGVVEPQWYEIDKSRKAPSRVRRALERGAELVFVWGGDGTVQRTADAMAGSEATLAILPAGTANLLATNLGVPKDLTAAVEIGLGGLRRRLDLGTMNGERFAVMAGVGFDALMIRDADRGAKDRFGRLAYVWAGARHLGDDVVDVKVKVDGAPWFEGPASCVLIGNVGTVTGGVEVFPDACPDDGVLELGVLSAHGVWQWSRVITRAVVSGVEKSPLVRTTAGRRVDVKLASKRPYELDGGARKKTDRLKVRIDAGALTVAVPSAA